MATKVNPPPSLRIPPTLANNQDTRVYFEQVNRILFQLWQRTGGGSDAIANIEDSALYDVGIKGAEIAEITKALDDLRVQISFAEDGNRALIEGVAPRQVYVQDDQPGLTGVPYLWVQTGLPGGGTTLWAEDGT